MKISILITLTVLWTSSVTRCSVDNDTSIWIDPAYNATASEQRIVVWFDDQYLENGDSFLKKAKEFNERSRGALRKEVMSALKAMSNRSFNKVKNQLNILKNSDQITAIEQHWIINGFSCTVTAEGFKTIKTLEGVDKIFTKKTPLISKELIWGQSFSKPYLLLVLILKELHLIHGTLKKFVPQKFGMSLVSQEKEHSMWYMILDSN